MRAVLSIFASAAIAFTVIAAADEKKTDDKREPTQKSGTVIGIVTAKGENFLEVKADGEEKGRRYVPEWVGGAPAQGGGPNKDTLKLIKDTPIGSRVKLEWKFEERARLIKLEILKKPNDKDAKKGE